jgi:hypothetical protein
VLTGELGALGAVVLEEFLALCGCDELHGSISVWADPSGPFAEHTDCARSARNRTQLISARSARIEAAPAVTAALRWRGRCSLDTLQRMLAEQPTSGRESALHWW